MKKLIALALATLLSSSAAYAADTQTHEFDGMCATGLALGKEVKTDCKINWTDTKSGKTYCFSSEEMKKTWATDTAANEKKAEEHYSKMHASAGHGHETSKTM